MSLSHLAAASARGFTLALLLILVQGAASGQVPHKLNYQGFLTDAANQPINATPSMVFKLYNVAMGGVALYTETQTVTVSNGAFDAVVGELNESGVRVFASFLGAGAEEGRGIDVGPDGRIYVVGSTFSTNFPVTTNALQKTNAGQSDGFLTIISP